VQGCWFLFVFFLGDLPPLGFGHGQNLTKQGGTKKSFFDATGGHQQRRKDRVRHPEEFGELAFPGFGGAGGGFGKKKKGQGQKGLLTFGDDRWGVKKGRFRGEINQGDIGFES